jgi:hypothetical protein
MAQTVRVVDPVPRSPVGVDIAVGNVGVGIPDVDREVNVAICVEEELSEALVVQLERSVRPFSVEVRLAALQRILHGVGAYSEQKPQLGGEQRLLGHAERGQQWAGHLLPQRGAAILPSQEVCVGPIQLRGQLELI